MNITNQKNGLAESLSSFLQNDRLDFQKIFNELLRHIRIIAGVSFVTLFIAFLYTFTIVPQYQTSAMIQIVSQNQGSNLFGNAGIKSNNMSVVDATTALIKTRYILEPVVTENGLNIIASPNYFPIFGEWMAKRYSGNTPANPLLWLNSYAWGGESIQIQKFIVPPSAIGATFKLVAGKDNTYKLYSSTNEIILRGRTGEEFVSGTNDKFILKVNKLVANPGTEFSLTAVSPINMANGLANSLAIEPVAGNDPSQSTGILLLRLSGTNSDVIRHTLNTIIQYSVIKNAQQKANETQRTINFLNQRLPIVQKNLEQAENALNQYHKNNGTLSMSIVSRLLVTQLTNIEQALQKLGSQKEELLQIYTPEHPLVQAAGRKQMALQKKYADLKAQIRQFPFENQQEINLEREARIKNAMYVSMLNNQQQLEIVKASLTPGIIALTDSTPPIQLPSHKILFMLAGLLFGAFAASIGVLIKSTFNKTIENATQLEDALQIPVQSIVPYSRKQKQMQKAHDSGLSVLGSTASPLILAKREPDDIAIESLRSLRVSLHIMSPSETSSIIAIMGSLSNIGKSFVSLNLAQVVADTGKRTLLIDADIRKGLIHKSLITQKARGLSEYLEGSCSYEDILRSVNENLSFISCGIFTKQPSELFQHKRFQDLIARVRNEFDQIIIDTPPILPVIDSVLISQQCDIKLFVVSAAKDTITDVKQAVKKAHSHGIQINGLVFNHRNPMSPYGSKYEYRYAYGNNS